MARCHSSTLIPLTNRKSFERVPSFSLLVCCPSCGLNGDALCSGRNGSHWETWAWHDREAFPYWTTLNHGCRSDMETKAHRPLSRKRAQMFGTEIRPARVCVCGHRAALHSLVCGRERGLPFHRRLSRSTTRDGLYQQNNLLKVVYSDSHRISRCPSFVFSRNYVAFVQTSRVFIFLRVKNPASSQNRKKKNQQIKSGLFVDCCAITKWNQGAFTVEQVLSMLL